MTRVGILALLLAAAPSAWAGRVSDRINLLDVPPAHDQWDLRVRNILVHAFDTDGSGSIDRTTELDGIRCDTWNAMDRAVRTGWSGSSFAVVYGVSGQLLWIGHALGFDHGVRKNVYQALDHCGLVPKGSQAPMTVAETVRALPNGGTNVWDARVRSTLVQAYDTDRSRALDRRREVEAIPCDVWEALEAGVQAGWKGQSMRQVYGFGAGLIWIGDVLGFEGAVRIAADQAAAECGLNVRPGGLRASLDTPDGELAQLGPGAAWHERARGVLLDHFDSDQSGALDRQKELKAIECESWRALDGSVRDRWGGAGVRSIYGFADDYVWLGYALGVSERLRHRTDRMIEHCGLDE